MSKPLSEANQYLKRSREASIKSAASSTAIETGKPTGTYIQRSSKDGKFTGLSVKSEKKPAS